MAQFWFAWVSAAETTFNSGHEREDEQVFSFEILHAEGDFARLSLEVKNPKTGFLSTGRKQWMWLSWDDGGTAGAVALFFGRLIGIPQNVQGEVIRMDFIARPQDFFAQKDALADAMRVRPWWDPAFVQPERRDDPDAVLESRSELWHIDRVSHVVTASDIITGEDGTLALTADDFFYDSLDVQYSQPPGRLVHCEAEVYWSQAVVGSVDITQDLIDAFRDAGTSHNYMISTYTGQGLASDWPEEGDRIGGGWSYGETFVTRADGTFIDPEETTTVVQNGVTVSWPLWSLLPVMNVSYDIKRSRSEKIIFDLESDVQALVTEPGDEEILYVTFSTSAIQEPVDEADTDNPDGTLPIGDLRRRAYFTTDRGRESLEYVMAVARARLLSRARAVTLTCEMPFATGTGLSCRQNMSVADTRLPGGTATGKVIEYKLVLNGDTGEHFCEVKLGCTVGTGNTVSTVAGDPDYVEAGYVETGYQTYSGRIIAPFADELAYTDFTSTPPNDDGVDFFNLRPDDIIIDINVINGVSVQGAVIAQPWPDFAAALEALNQVYTEVEINLVPLNTGPFHTDYTVTVSDLMVPKTIDLEAA